MSNPVQKHYQRYPYPRFPLLASLRRCDTYAINLEALWIRFNRSLPPQEARQILLAGCGTFSPYPFSVANPKAAITALDLSKTSLKRARLHCLLHGCRNVVYRCGDLLDESVIGKTYGLIDSYGVLHHLDDPLGGLKALARHLMPGGIIRIMLYSRYARRDEESIRRALNMLKISSVREARHIFAKARPGSRLARYLELSDETATESGLADALLHPRVRTFRLDELLELVAGAGLQPLLFAHPGALEDVSHEIARLRVMEEERRSPGNFVVYLGAANSRPNAEAGSSRIVLNPCLVSAVSRFKLAPLQIPPRIGCSNAPLHYSDRSFLRQFSHPLDRNRLSTDLSALLERYKRQLFLLEYNI